MGRIQSKLSSGYRLGQGSTVNITSRKALPVQVDGEPFMLAPSVTTVTFKNQGFHFLGDTTAPSACSCFNSSYFISYHASHTKTA